jgi:hypothetical protein
MEEAFNARIVSQDDLVCSGLRLRRLCSEGVGSMKMIFPLGIQKPSIEERTPAAYFREHPRCSLTDGEFVRQQSKPSHGAE